jgi:hypothetical protein
MPRPPRNECRIELYNKYREDCVKDPGCKLLSQCGALGLGGPSGVPLQPWPPTPEARAKLTREQYNELMKCMTAQMWGEPAQQKALLACGGPTPNHVAERYGLPKNNAAPNAAKVNATKANATKANAAKANSAKNAKTIASSSSKTKTKTKTSLFS